MFVNDIHINVDIMIFLCCLLSAYYICVLLQLSLLLSVSRRRCGVSCVTIFEIVCACELRGTDLVVESILKSTACVYLIHRMQYRISNLCFKATNAVVCLEFRSSHRFSRRFFFRPLFSRAPRTLKTLNTMPEPHLHIHTYNTLIIMPSRPAYSEHAAF